MANGHLVSKRRISVDGALATVTSFDAWVASSETRRLWGTVSGGHLRGDPVGKRRFREVGGVAGAQYGGIATHWYHGIRAPPVAGVAEPFVAAARHYLPPWQVLAAVVRCPSGVAAIR